MPRKTVKSDTATQAQETESVEQAQVDTQENAQPESETVTTTKPIVPKEVDPHQLVTVRNGYQGRLVCKNKHTGELFVWDAFGAEQDIELSELKSIKNSSKKFFENNWFMFDEAWVVDYLGVSRYYKYAVKIEDFDKLFTKPVDELADAISKMSDGQKKSVAYRARQLIAEGAIDSNRVITTLEQCLGTDLIEH